MTDEQFDQQFAGLARVEPPQALQQRVLATYREERRRDGRRTRAVALVGMFAMAALTLLVVREEQGAGDVDQMVERGSGESPAAVSLKLAVSRPGEPGGAARFATGQRYTEGDTLHFRVSASKPVTLTLRRDDHVLWTGPVPAGETDLPVGYAFEAGESQARLVLEGGAEPVVVTLPPVGAAEVSP